MVCPRMVYAAYILSILAAATPASTSHVTRGGGRRVQSSVAERCPPSAATLPNPISLGNVRPEGITEGLDDTMFITNLFYGGVRKLDVVTGEVSQVVPDVGFFEQPAIGLTYHDGLLIVAGAGPAVGATAQVTVYDAASGEKILACSPLGPAVFMNDVIVVEDVAYITDSGRNYLMTMSVAAATAGECEIGEIELPAEDFLATEQGVFLANGLVAYENGLVIVSSAGGLFFHSFADDSTVMIAMPEDVSSGSDGLVIDGDRLYITNNASNNIIVVDLSMEGGCVAATLVGSIESELFDSPATSAQYGAWLYSVNARFATVGFPGEGEEDLTTFAEEFHVVAVRKSDVVAAED